MLPSLDFNDRSRSLSHIRHTKYAYFQEGLLSHLLLLLSLLLHQCLRAFICCAKRLTCLPFLILCTCHENSASLFIYDTLASASAGLACGSRLHYSTHKHVCAGFLLGKRRMQRHTNVRECAAAYAVASAETAHPGNHQEVIAIVGV